MATYNEKHYQPSELAEMWGLSEDTIRDRFKDEPGVIKVGHSGLGRRKRPYVRMTIPESVAARVHAKLTAPFTASQTRHRSGEWTEVCSSTAQKRKQQDASAALPEPPTTGVRSD